MAPKFGLSVQTCKTFLASLLDNDPEPLLSFFRLTFLDDVEGGPLVMCDARIGHTCAGDNTVLVLGKAV